MPFSQIEETTIESLSRLDQSELIERILDFSKYAWDEVIDKQSIGRWLGNYTGEYYGNAEAEQNMMLWILQNYVYYTDKDVRNMISNAWWKYINYHLTRYSSFGFMNEFSTSERVSYIKNQTIIQPLGNCSGSGTNIAYYMRSINGLSKEMFNMTLDKEYKYLVLVDDATISGRQAMENLDAYKFITDKEKIILTLISTETARKKIGNYATVLSSIELDETSLCFKDRSNLFHLKPEWRHLAKRLCHYYGKKVCRTNPLGYSSGQYLFSFFYNTPNNTLPVFWATVNGWRPLFTRYFVEESLSGELCDEKFY